MKMENQMTKVIKGQLWRTRKIDLIDVELSRSEAEAMGCFDEEDLEDQVGGKVLIGADIGFVESLCLVEKVRDDGRVLLWLFDEDFLGDCRRRFWTSEKAMNSVKNRSGEYEWYESFRPYELAGKTA